MHRRNGSAPLALGSALLLALNICVSPVRAQDKTGAKPSARDQLEALRPSGPVTVKADRVDWVQDSAMKYSGNVSLASDTLSVRGAEMEIKQYADGNFEATISGKPAQLDHAPRPDTTGLAAQPVSAEAQTIRYDSRNGTADLAGGARLRRGSDEINGEMIGYIVGERRIRAASGGGSGQVTITFDPPPPKPDSKSSAKPKDKKP